MTPDATFLASWLAAAFFLMGGIYQGVKLWDRMKGHPPASELALSAEELRRRIEVMEIGIEEVKSRHDEAFTLEQKAASERRRLIYDKIEVSATETRNHVERARRELKDDISKVHERVDDILRALANQKGKG